MNQYTTRPNLYLDPDAGDAGAGGGAPGDGAPAPVEGAPAAPSFDPAQFESRINGMLESFESKFSSRFQDYDTRFQQMQAPKTQEEDKPPRMKDFLNEDGVMDAEAFEKFQDAKLNYTLKKERATWEQQQTEAREAEERESRQQSIIQSHIARIDAYAKNHPDYNPNASLTFRNDAVTLAIADSEFSAHIHHFLQKNPDKLSELRNMERTSGPIAALRYIGRLESRFEAQDQNKNTPAPVARPTRGAFGGAGAKPVQRSPEEIISDWRL